MNVVLLSAGIDSLGALFYGISQKENLVAMNLNIILSTDNQQDLRTWMINHPLQRELCEKICKKLGIKLIKIDINLDDIQLSSKTPVEQKYFIASLCGILSKFNPEIKKFYYGLCNEDLTVVDPTRTWSNRLIDMQKIIESMDSEAIILSPISHLTKSEILDLIPKDYFQYITTCWYQTSKSEKRCMQCFKCLKYKNCLDFTNLILLDQT